MKKSILTLSIIMAAAIAIVSCKGEEGDDPTPAQLPTEALTGAYATSSSKTWTLSNVTFDGFEDRTSDWTGFTLTMSNNPSGSSNSYTAASAYTPGPWPSTGSWRFGGTADNPNINQVIRDAAPEELDIAIVVNATQLVMTFTFDDAVHRSGRTEVVNGEYSFTFTAN